MGFREIFENVLAGKNENSDIIDELNLKNIEFVVNGNEIIVEGKAGIENNDGKKYLKINENIIKSVGTLEKKKINENEKLLLTSENYHIKLSGNSIKFLRVKI